MVIAILTVFIMLNVVLKLSFWKLWQQALFAAVCFLFVWLATDFASEQSQVTLQTMLSDPKVLGNITVLLTVETAVCMTYLSESLHHLFLDYFQLNDGYGSPNCYADCQRIGVLYSYPRNHQSKGACANTL